jgi:hypothetical protein
LRNGTHTTCTTAVVTWRERAARSACQFAAPEPQPARVGRLRTPCQQCIV